MRAGGGVAACGVLQTLFGMAEIEPQRREVCRCGWPAPLVKAATALLLTTRCAPELEQMQAELGVYLVPGWCAHSGELAACLAGKQPAHPHAYRRPGARRDRATHRGLQARAAGAARAVWPPGDPACGIGAQSLA